MAGMREEFYQLDVNQLKKLIQEFLKFIDNVAPFKETKEITAKQREQIAKETNETTLQTQLINLMSVIAYWDTHQNKDGLFAPVEKEIVKEMLVGKSKEFNLRRSSI